MDNREQRLILFVLALVAGSLWFYPWLDARRLSAGPAAPETEFVVTSPTNNGPGSLRDAMFRALRAPVPSQIVIRAREIELETPLPPLAGRSDITIRSDGEPSVLDASALSNVPVLDVRAGNVAIENLSIRGARGYAIHVLGPGPVRIDHVTIDDSDVGVGAAGGYRVAVSDSRFTANRIGVELLGSGTGLIARTSFADHLEAGAWVVGLADNGAGDASLEVSDSRFSGARYGMVLANVAVNLRRNEVSSFVNDGILVLGGVLEAAENNIWNGRGAAIRSVGLTRGDVSLNQVHENGAIGILVQSASGTRVDDNRVFRNVYGIVTVQNNGPGAVTLTNNLVVAQSADGLVAVGDSPVITQNKALANGSAGIRILDLILPSAEIRSTPLLADNVLMDNALNDPVYSEYRSEDPRTGTARDDGGSR